MNIDMLIAILTALGAVGGLGGIAGIITAISNAVVQHRRAREASVGEQIEAALSPLVQKANKQEEELREIRLDNTRIQLYMKMEHDPHNYDTILMIAQRYFVELHGDWCVTADFQKWADREKIKIPTAIIDAIAANEKVK